MYRYSHLFSLCILLLMAGCGNRTELNELGITSASGYDGEAGNWTITYQIINPSALASGSNSSSSVGSQSPVHNFSLYGKTIREAIATSNLQTPRKLYFSHNNIVVIGKKTAEQGIEEILDNYFRNTDKRETVKVFIADGEARDFLTKLAPPEKIPGQTLAEISQKSAQFGSYFPSVTIHDLALKISSDSGAAGVPELSISDSDAPQMKSTDEYKHTFTKSKLTISGLCVFEKSKVRATLGKKESLGVSWLTNQVKTTTISSFDHQSRESSVFIQKAKVKATPLKMKNSNHFTLVVNAKLEGELMETTAKNDLKSMQSLEQLQRQTESIVEKQMLEGWSAVQRLKTDLIGIADNVHRKYPGEWKQIRDSWTEELAAMDIEIHVAVNIKRVGLLQNSFSDLLKSD